MSLSHCIRVATRLSTKAIFTPKPIIPTWKPAVLATIPPTNLKIAFTPQLINLDKVPVLRKEIVDPLAGILGVKETPTYRKSEWTLPEIVKDELVEPTKSKIPAKRAARLIVIRRHKMKKHKWRKLQKKMKFEFARRRQRRELRKEKAFQAVLIAKVKEAEQFNVSDYIENKLKIAHWQRPITRVRGFYAPDNIIREHLRSKEKERIMKQRIEDCLRLSKF